MKTKINEPKLEKWCGLAEKVLSELNETGEKILSYLGEIPDAFNKIDTKTYYNKLIKDFYSILDSKINPQLDLVGKHIDPKEYLERKVELMSFFENKYLKIGENIFGEEKN
jgi:hypothetical protein